MTEPTFMEKHTVECEVNWLVKICYGAAKDSGWHDGIDPNTKYLFPARLCLIHSEISEAMEAHRKGLKDDKLAHREGAEVELADALIRICDLAGAMGYDLGGAVQEKLRYNAKRADHKPENRTKAGGKSY